MSSQITHTHTHTIIKMHPLAHILDTWALIISSSALFTVYLDRIMQRHPSPLQVITTRARRGGRKNSVKQKWQRETHSVTYLPGLSTLSDLSRIVAQSPPSFLCCLRATFTPSIQPYLGLPRKRPLLTSAINTLLAIRYLFIHSFHMPKPSQYSLNCSTR